MSERMSEQATALLTKLRERNEAVLIRGSGAWFVNDWPDGSLARDSRGWVVTYGEVAGAPLTELIRSGVLLMDDRRLPQELVYCPAERLEALCS